MPKTAIVTGASGGIGREIAVKLGCEGYSVAVLYGKSEDKAQKTVALVEATGAKARAYACDVRQSEQVKTTVAALTADFGTPYLLVNNAGISEQKLFTDITDEDWNDMLAVHLSGAFYMSRAVLPLMLHEKNGRIINIASMWGETGGSCEVHYSAAKAGLIGMTRALAKELAPSGITVNAVSPGAIATDMMRVLGEETCRLVEEEIPVGRLGTPADVANAVAFLAKDESAYITGQVLSVNGGMVI